MKCSTSALWAAGLASHLVSAIPAPRPVMATYASDPAAVPTAALDASPDGPPQASGAAIRGPANLRGWNPSTPVQSSTPQIGAEDIQLAPGQTEDADLGLYLDFSNIEKPQPIRGGSTAPTDPGPQSYEYEKLNSDLFAPPGTDSGDVPNAKWPLGLSHAKHGNPGSAGWARQQNVGELPSATGMAGVDMRLSPNAYRELHWHKANEWSLVLNGTLRLQSVNDAGETFIDDLQAGDVWFFPSGIPHSIQALEDGCEFLLVFDDGSFSEDGTFLASQLYNRMPQSVLAKNTRSDASDFASVPDISGGRYIFPGTPAPANISAQNVTGAAGVIPPERTYSYHFSQQAAYEVPGGSVKIIDSASFPTADNFAAALVTVEPGAMREIHWHTTSDEWNYFLQGQARVSIYDAPSASRTFDFRAGDVGYIPVPQAHYIENTGNETLVFLEVLQAPRFTDISVNQWLGLTSKQIVTDTLNITEEVADRFPTYEPYIVPGNANLTTTNFTSTPALKKLKAKAKA